MDIFWVKDGRYHPEEEYFRLCCLALKIVCIERDQEFYFSVRNKLYHDASVLVGATKQALYEVQG